VFVAGMQRSGTNMLMDLPTLIRVFWRSFIKWWH